MESSIDKDTMIKRILEADALYPTIERHFSYGTAGFRTLGSYLDKVCFRAGLLSAIRAKVTPSLLTGVMVTASHNPKQDNGIKIVEADGSMLHTDWEKKAEALVNSKDLVETLNWFDTEYKEYNIFKPNLGYVFVGRDTRSSSD